MKLKTEKYATDERAKRADAGWSEIVLDLTAAIQLLKSIFFFNHSERRLEETA